MDPRRKLDEAAQARAASTVSEARRIAASMVRRLPRCVSADEIVAACLVGLTEAARDYREDRDRGGGWLAYAHLRMRSAARDYLRTLEFYPGARRAGKDLQGMSLDGCDASGTPHGDSLPSPEAEAAQEIESREARDEARAEILEYLGRIPPRHAATVLDWLEYPSAAAQARAQGVTESTISLRRTAARKAMRQAQASGAPVR